MTGSAGWSSGHTRIYELTGSNWSQLGTDINGEADNDDSGYSVSMNSVGDRVVIGSRDNLSSRGHARIYEITGSDWSQVGTDIDGENSIDYSGFSVSMNSIGDRVAIGAVLNDDNGNNSGHTRIYEITGSDWSQVGTDIDGEAAGDQSGVSVSMNGTGSRVAIGAVLNDGIAGADSGHVRIYEITGSDWSQVGTDIDGEAAGDQSGVSVSMNSIGDRVAIGAVLNDGNGIESGHTRIYEITGSDWSQLGIDIDGENVGDQSGTSVSMNSAGSRVAIGAPYNSGSADGSGHTRIFKINSDNKNLQIDNTGNVFASNLLSELKLTSPNGIAFRITVDGSGNLTTIVDV